MDIGKKANLNSVLYDIIQGDIDLVENLDLYEKLDMSQILTGLEFLLGNQDLTPTERLDLLDNSWRVIYREKPPSPDDFLKPPYLGEGIIIYPRVKETFKRFADPDNFYRNAILYPHIGWGKSYLSVLWNLYTTTHLALMHNAKKYLGQSDATTLYQVFCSFNLKKSAEVLLEPMINILESSEFFEQVRTKKDIAKKRNEYEKKGVTDHKLYWTTASRNGVAALQFSNGVSYKLASSANAILGLTIVCATLSELAFFRESGKSDSYIMQFYNDAKGRVWSRMKNKDDPTGLNYWGRSILDSSPNDLESPVDQYCMYDAEKDSKNMVIKGAVWDWTPQDFDNLDDRFPVFKGGNGKPPRILENTEGYDSSDIIMVPKQVYQLFHDDLRKALKDLSGIPQGNLDKLFYDYDKINNCFISGLRSVDFCIRADARMSPHNLIWNQIVNTFFIKSGFGYQFYYKSGIPRVLHIDQSVSTDMSSICLLHIERKASPDGSFSLERDVIYVVDMVIPIHPFGGRINLEAIKDFIIDLYTLGSIPLAGISYDQYQSEPSIQALQRMELPIEHVSVDSEMDAYLYLAQQVEQGNLKIGRNIFFKNNLKSLRVTQRPRTKSLKIDHTMGDSPNPANSDYNWETSLLGINAKDVSDSVAGAMSLARKLLTTDGRFLLQEWDESKIVLTSDDIKTNTYNLIKNLGFAV